MANPRAERVKDVARLGTRSGRNKAGQFLAEGPQAVREATRLHAERTAQGGDGVVRWIFATPEAAERYPDLVAGSSGTEVRLAEPAVIAAMADTVTPQGIIAVCQQTTVALEEIIAAGPRLVAVLCRVQDPGNAGTILRAADAAGADAVVTTSGSVDLFNPKAVRSTVGSIFHLPLAAGVEFAELVEALRAAGIGILAADGYGDADLDELQDGAAAHRLGDGAGEDPLLARPSAWLFGNEAAGLDASELGAADERVAVPLYGVAESLNVGTAATVCLYASARAQRPKASGHD
ncbi:RNA methyltransferase [Zhihengliuella salsuginis]|uniref:RNA methyltransferase n=2 Tax=Zhihengliuella salsuginis TaxID=578222 RepID=A0ABQ3GJ85_9MICC|nr:RNA methyltransferase [Zhihengliuella salsuginis]